jgi:SAM-dependent methyltransferase
MPTIPPERTPPSGSEPRESHQYREVAESFGADAERYNRARPSYPQALVDRVITTSPGRDILDVGCGTGISSRLFQAAGCEVLGVDPDPRMAELARQGGLAVEVAKFEDWESAGRAFDAVIAGQAWHWVDPVAGAAKAARVLRPGGRLTVFWNTSQPPPDLNEAFGAVYQRVLPEGPFGRGRAGRGMPGPDAYSALCAKAADGMRQAGAFGDPEQWHFDWDRPYTRDEWLDTVPTFGGHNQMPPDTLAELLKGMGAAIDAAGGSFTMSYATLAATAVRTAGQ